MADGTLEIAATPSDGAAGEERLQRLLSGDGRAFEAFVQAHQHRVYAFCYRMLNDREEALDVAQDVFLSVHQSLSTFRRDAKLSTWILRISKNHCLNRLKYLARRGARGREALAQVSEARLAAALEPPASPEQPLVAEAERRRVQAAIARLETDQRILVVLRDLEGLPYEELVEITELPIGTVKSRLHRARERLADLLDEEASP